MGFLGTCTALSLPARNMLHNAINSFNKLTLSQLNNICGRLNMKQSVTSLPTNFC